MILHGIIFSILAKFTNIREAVGKFPLRDPLPLSIIMIKKFTYLSALKAYISDRNMNGPAMHCLNQCYGRLDGKTFDFLHVYFTCYFVITQESTD